MEQSVEWLLCGPDEGRLLADSVEKLDVAAEVSVHRGWNFEALLFLRLQSGPDARFSC
jgi:hypothetical protein